MHHTVFFNFKKDIDRDEVCQMLFTLQLNNQWTQSEYNMGHDQK